MALQMNKCIFCERQFENELYGKIEFDLEHFRPKSSVKAWPDPSRHPWQYDFETGGADEAGYFWLPYDLQNYAASCKVCNTSLKSNYFPIAGTRITAPGDLAAEQQFLCYPLGEIDEDPANILTFVATTAVPAVTHGHLHRRAKVTIDFFDLNGREQLHRERANMIVLLGQSLAAIEAGIGDANDAALVEAIVSPLYPHTACVRAFSEAWDTDRPFARKILSACKAYVAAGQGAAPPEP